MCNVQCVFRRFRHFGAQDGGLPAIAEFFSTHRCNNICSSWPGLDVPQVKGQAEVKVHRWDSPPGGARSQNRPRRNCNLYTPHLDAGHDRGGRVVPKVPSAPLFETTRF